MTTPLRLLRTAAAIGLLTAAALAMGCVTRVADHDGDHPELWEFEPEVLVKNRNRTDGKGIDVVLDVIGAPYWERNLNSLAVRGRLVIVGSMGGSKLETDLRLLGPKRLRVHGTALRSRPIEEKIVLSQQIAKRVVPLLESGAVKPVIDRVFPLEETGAAHAYMEDNANFGKIVLSME